MTDDNPTADRPAQPDVAATVEAALAESMRDLRQAHERDVWAHEWNSLPTALDRLAATIAAALAEARPQVAEDDCDGPQGDPDLCAEHRDGKPGEAHEWRPGRRGRARIVVCRPAEPEQDDREGLADHPLARPVAETVPAHRLRAVQSVLADRERELLRLKGPCPSCGLHYAHSGPCDARRPAEPVQGDRADTPPDDIRAAIERSSLGTPEAQALRATVSDEHASAIVQLARSFENEADTPPASEHREALARALWETDCCEHRLEEYHGDADAILARLAAEGWTLLDRGAR